MTAELTDGETQAQILDVLGVSDTAELRKRVSAVWEEIYEDNGKEISVLANSLWLDKDVEYVQEKMDSIAYDYYASVYQGDLGSEKTNKAMTNWMRNQTGGLLKDRTLKCQLEPKDQVLAIASTIYFQSQWADKFNASDNTHGMFHAVTGDEEATFMNKKEYHMNYYWGEDFGAVQMFLENGSYMWFILPDEGKTVDDVLASDEYMDMITQLSNNSEEESNRKWMKVNLSVPQFDVSASTDLKEALQAAGLTNLFELYGNDFSPSIIKANENDDPVYLDSINQDTRVKIDEKGVVAASYIELNFGEGAAMPPPDEVIDFVLDRPFVFAITKSQIPLFVGTVNTP
jgi:serine protease inhibitor